MRWLERMRYYQPFPAAIPLWKAGYPRVTHPSATKLKESLRKDLPVVPFDLHVLGTPPAFILSQDQTLMLKFFISLRKCCDLNMKEILMVKMDLAFHFYPFTELGCSKITWLLKWFSTIQCPLNFLNFASVARSIKWPLSSTKCCYLKYKGIYSGLHFCLVLI